MRAATTNRKPLPRALLNAIHTRLAQPEPVDIGHEAHDYEEEPAAQR